MSLFFFIVSSNLVVISSAFASLKSEELCLLVLAYVIALYLLTSGSECFIIPFLLSLRSGVTGCSSTRQAWRIFSLLPTFAVGLRKPLSLPPGIGWRIGWACVRVFTTEHCPFFSS